MFGWLQRLFSTPSDELVVDLAEGFVAPLHIRAYTPNDFAACREIYALSVPESLPSNFESHFQSSDNLRIVMEKDGMVCGCGETEITELCGQAALLFGVIHPDHCGQDFEATLLLARIAMLPPGEWTVVVSPTPEARKFYEGFNFQEVDKLRITAEKTISRHSVRVTPEARLVCLQRLKGAGVTFDASLTAPPISDQE